MKQSTLLFELYMSFVFCLTFQSVFRCRFLLKEVLHGDCFWSFISLSKSVVHPLVHRLVPAVVAPPVATIAIGAIAGVATIVVPGLSLSLSLTLAVGVDVGGGVVVVKTAVGKVVVVGKASGV